MRMGYGYGSVRRRLGTSVPPTGNWIKPANIAAAYAAYQAAVPGDVIDCNGAWFTPGASYLWVHNKSFAAPGVRIQGHPSQNMIMTGDTVAGSRTEYAGCYMSADAHWGNSNPAIAYEYSNVDFRDVTMVAFRGCKFGQSEWGIMLRGGSGCADITIDNNVFCFQRSDCIRSLNGAASNRIVMINNYFADLCHQERYWAKADGTTPILSSQTQSGYTKVVEPDHPDIIQAYGAGTGTATDHRIQYNTMKAQGGQVIFYADGFQVRCLAADNYVYPAQVHAIRFGESTDCQILRNTVALLADYDPDTAQGLITLNRPGGVGNAKAGLNVYNPAFIGVSTDTGISMSGAISGTATDPTAPTWDTTTATVGSPAVVRALPSYTDYAARAVMLKNPYIYVDGTSAPYAVGVRLKLVWEVVKGWRYDLDTTAWHRWKKDGAVVGGSAGVGLAYAVSPVTTAGSWVGEWSDDSTDGVNGTWKSSAAVTVAAAGTTLDPADKSAEITLSGGNLTATHTGTDNTHALAKSVADIPAANGNYYWEVDVSLISGSQTGIAIIGNAKANNIDPHDFNGPCLAIFGNGSMFGSGGFTGNCGNMGGAGKAYGAGQKFGVYLRRAGAVDKLFIIYPDHSWASATGDPTGVGAGIDCSAATSGQVLSAPAYTQKTGDVTVMTYGGTFAHAAQIGTVTTL